MKFKLIEFSNIKNIKEVYHMYKSLPQNEMGSTNKFYNDSYDEFIIKFNNYVQEETILNVKTNSCCTRYVFYVNNNPLEKCKEFGFKTIRINCDDKNIASKKNNRKKWW